MVGYDINAFGKFGAPKIGFGTHMKIPSHPKLYWEWISDPQQKSRMSIFIEVICRTYKNIHTIEEHLT